MGQVLYGACKTGGVPRVQHERKAREASGLMEREKILMSEALEDLRKQIRSSEAEDDLLLADVDGRRGTEDTVVGGSDTLKTTAGSQSSETDGYLFSESERSSKK